MNITTQIQIILDDSIKTELNYEKGNSFERMVRWILESRDYEVVSNVNITIGEIDLWCKHKFDDKETLFVECKAKAKVSVTDLQTFGYKVSRKKPDKAYFIHTTELDHDSAGIKKEEFDKDSDLKHITFYDPSKIIELLLSQKKISAIDESVLPKETTKRFLIFSYLGDFYAFIANTTSLATPNEFCLFSAKDGSPISDKKIVHVLQERIPELKKLDFKGINSKKETVSVNPIKSESVVEIPESESWNDYKPASSEHFVGRTAVRADFLHMIKDVVAKKTKKRVFYLSAKSGMGKSSLINAFKGTCSNKQHKKKYFAYAIDSINAETQRFVGLAFEKMLQSAMQNGFIDVNELKNKKLSFVSDYDLLGSKSIQEILEYLNSKGKVMILIFDQFEDVFRREHLYKPFHEFLLQVNDAKSNLIVGFSWKQEITLTPSNDSYKFWMQAKDLAKPFELDGFNYEELNQIIRQLESEPKVGTLPRGFKDLLTEISLGYPWLIKKLCIHIFNEVKKGRKISELSKSNLNISTLFKQDIDGLTNEEDKALRVIARYAENGSFFHDSDIPDVVSLPTISSLLQKRLIIKTGLVYKPYWDVFREFILTGNIPPLTINFYLRQYPEVCFNVFKVFVPNEKYSLEEVLKRYGSKAKKGHLENMLIELRRLDLIIKDDETGLYYLPDKVSPTIEDFNRISKEKIRNTKVFSEILNSDDGILSATQLSSILKNCFSFSSISDASWIHYSKVLIGWIYYLDLFEKDKLLKQERGRCSNKDFSGSKHDIILQSYPETLCDNLSNILKKGLMQYKKAFPHTISRDLRALGILEKKGSVLKLNDNFFQLIELANNNEVEFKKAIANTASSLDKLKTATLIYRSNPKILAATFFADYPELFGIGIKSKASGQVYAAKVLAWANFIVRSETDFYEKEKYTLGKEEKSYKKVEGLMKKNYERSIEAWETQYNNLKKYYNKHGHTNLKARDGSLGTWVVAQRQYKSTLTKEQIERLDKLKFVWDPREIAWEEMFAEWLKYKNKYPNRTLLVQDKEFRKIGQWVDKQRKLNRQKKLSPHRFLKLDAENFPFFSKIQWIDSYIELKKHFNQFGNIDLVPTPENRKLREWLTQQKFKVKNDLLSKGKAKLLAEIGLKKN